VRLGDVLVRDGRSEPYLVPYLLVNRRRRPQLETTVRAIRDGGAAALELGFPFSDPIADGPVLEAADVRALEGGTTWSDLVHALRVASPILPAAVMTYANPVWRRGLDDALAELHDAGAGGVIVPDLSWEESGPWRQAARKAGLDLVLFAAPGVGTARVARIAAGSRGFLYLVSRYGTTGRGATQSARSLRPLVDAAHRAAPRLPVLIGFGVRDRASRDRALASGADGVVVGTALEERLSAGATPRSLQRWVASLAH
jgi:tryptophan synthase alpha chain